MDEVLGTTAGNALEVRESVDHLTGARARAAAARGDGRARRRGARAGQAGARRRGRARSRSQSVLDDGSAAERFGAMVAALGGPSDFVENPELPTASVTRPVAPERPGYVERVDARAVGLVVTGLGGNRRREDDQIDYGVGLSRRRADRRRGRAGPAARDRPRARRLERRRGRARAARRRPRRTGAAGRAARPARARMRSAKRSLSRTGHAPAEPVAHRKRHEPAARRAARPPRGHGPARADPEARRPQRAEGARGRLRDAGQVPLGRLPRLPAHVRPRGERDPHAPRTTATSRTST